MDRIDNFSTDMNLTDKSSTNMNSASKRSKSRSKQNDNETSLDAKVGNEYSNCPRTVFRRSEIYKAIRNCSSIQLRQAIKQSQHSFSNSKSQSSVSESDSNYTTFVTNASDAAYDAIDDVSVEIAKSDRLTDIDSRTTKFTNNCEMEGTESNGSAESIVSCNTKISSKCFGTLDSPNPRSTIRVEKTESNCKIKRTKSDDILRRIKSQGTFEVVKLENTVELSAKPPISNLKPNNQCSEAVASPADRTRTDDCSNQVLSVLTKESTSCFTFLHIVVLSTYPNTELQMLPMIYQLSLAGLCIDDEDYKGRTALSIAIRKQLREIMIALLRVGADPQANDYLWLINSLRGPERVKMAESFERYWPGMWNAVESGNTGVLYILANSWCRVDISRCGYSLLDHALELVSRGDLDPALVELLHSLSATVEFVHASLAFDTELMASCLRTGALTTDCCDVKDISHHDLLTNSLTPRSLRQTLVAMAAPSDVIQLLDNSCRSAKCQSYDSDDYSNDLKPWTPPDMSMEDVSITTEQDLHEQFKGVRRENEHKICQKDLPDGSAHQSPANLNELNLPLPLTKYPAIQNSNDGNSHILTNQNLEAVSVERVATENVIPSAPERRAKLTRQPPISEEKLDYSPRSNGSPRPLDLQKCSRQDLPNSNQTSLFDRHIGRQLEAEGIPVGLEVPNTTTTPLKEKLPIEHEISITSCGRWAQQSHSSQENFERTCTDRYWKKEWTKIAGLNLDDSDQRDDGDCDRLAHIATPRRREDRMAATGLERELDPERREQSAAKLSRRKVKSQESSEIDKSIIDEGLSPTSRRIRSKNSEDSNFYSNSRQVAKHAVDRQKVKVTRATSLKSKDEASVVRDTAASVYNTNVQVDGATRKSGKTVSETEEKRVKQTKLATDNRALSMDDATSRLNEVTEEEESNKREECAYISDDDIVYGIGSSKKGTPDRPLTTLTPRCTTGTTDEFNSVQQQQQPERRDKGRKWRPKVIRWNRKAKKDDRANNESMRGEQQEQEGKGNSSKLCSIS